MNEFKTRLLVSLFNNTLLAEVCKIRIEVVHFFFIETDNSTYNSFPPLLHIIYQYFYDYFMQ